MRPPLLCLKRDTQITSSRVQVAGCWRNSEFQFPALRSQREKAEKQSEWEREWGSALWVGAVHMAGIAFLSHQTLTVASYLRQRLMVGKVRVTVSHTQRTYARYTLKMQLTDDNKRQEWGEMPQIVSAFLQLNNNYFSLFFSSLIFVHYGKNIFYLYRCGILFT